MKFSPRDEALRRMLNDRILQAQAALFEVQRNRRELAQHAQGEEAKTMREMQVQRAHAQNGDVSDENAYLDAAERRRMLSHAADPNLD